MHINFTPSLWCELRRGLPKIMMHMYMSLQGENELLKELPSGPLGGYAFYSKFTASWESDYGDMIIHIWYPFLCAWAE